jgi:general secretion pathway protein H
VPTGNPVAKVTTRTSAPGSEPGPGGAASRRRGPRCRTRGFTLIELLVVAALIAIASATAALALRDPSATRLEREAARLSALLEAARAEARASGVTVRWMPTSSGEGRLGGFRFTGLPKRAALPTDWLTEGVSAEVLGAPANARGAVLGPEPVIGAQRILLRLESQRLTLVTDGLGPFEVASDEDGAANAPR